MKLSKSIFLRLDLCPHKSQFAGEDTCKGIEKFLVFLLFFFATPIIAQEKPPLVQVNGYLKELGTFSTDNRLNKKFYDNLIHNRINSTWNISPRIELKADLRTRVFHGHTVEFFPNYVDFLEQDNGVMDMSWVWIREADGLVHSTIDRLYLNYSAEKWQLSIGRQRINWGQNYVWNSNDIFNTYSYLDFDYEERPGADAIRFQYYKGYASGFEIAFAPRETWEESVAAFLIKTNVLNYDFQFLAGYYQQELALGMGWAGNIKGAGFKGELTYFHPEQNLQDTTGYISASIGLDYVFANGLYLQGEFLYNGAWQEGTNPALILAEPLPANNLFPAKTVLFINVSYPISPIVSLGTGVIKSPTNDLHIIVPSATISLTQSTDFFITAQLFRSPAMEAVMETNNAVFARLKYSF